MAATASVPILPIGYEGKVVVVTGASQGIGRVLATGFATAGAKTLFVARGADELRALEEQIVAAGYEGRAVVADLGEPAGVDALLDAAAVDYGEIDVLINNVGVAGPIGPIEDTALAEWQRTVDVNLTSAFLAIRGAVPGMKRNGGGSIINIGSVNGKIPFAFRSAYAATKMGLIGLTRTLAVELGSSGIRVNCILPGNVAGERVERILAAQAEAKSVTIEEVRQEVLDLSPLKTQVAPESILNVALFLGSEYAQHMTGQDVNVTAGMVMH
jgi:NAD(P)-dependent dehydrogenase (short-subunit alcohol dehydrogenase family)